MRVKILQNIYDGKRKIFNQNEILPIVYECDAYIRLITKWNIKYCISTAEENKSYIRLSDENE